ncbi:FAD/NAD(P)-binding protein, partial [Streptomyces sp. SID8455]|nr:FAD/NAD(P)-binding protein [Streptomyces sp. SID8455]
TVASQITVFTDESTRIAGPVVPGPTLYEWSTALASSAEPGGLPPEVVEEARGLGPDDYPSRAFYGCYLNDCFRRVVESAPEHVSVTL